MDRRGARPRLPRFLRTRCAPEVQPNPVHERARDDRGPAQLDQRRQLDECQAADDPERDRTNRDVDAIERRDVLPCDLAAPLAPGREQTLGCLVRPASVEATQDPAENGLGRLRAPEQRHR